MDFKGFFFQNKITQFYFFFNKFPLTYTLFIIKSAALPFTHVLCIILLVGGKLCPCLSSPCSQPGCLVFLPLLLDCLALGLHHFSTHLQCTALVPLDHLGFVPTGSQAKPGLSLKLVSRAAAYSSSLLSPLALRISLPPYPHSSLLKT